MDPAMPGPVTKWKGLQPGGVRRADLAQLETGTCDLEGLPFKGRVVHVCMLFSGFPVPPQASKTRFLGEIEGKSSDLPLGA